MAAPTTTSILTADDFFSTTLSSTITSTDTTIYLNALPSGSEGFLVLDQDNSSREIIYYNSVGVNFVTCPDVSTGRAQGGTTAAAHNTGASAKQNVVTQYWKELQNGHAISTVPGEKILNPYKFSAYRNSALTLASDATCIFNVKNFDTNSNYDTSTGIFTAPVTGVYFFVAQIGWVITSHANIAFGQYLYKNNTTDVGRFALVNMYASSYTIETPVVRLLQLTVGDTIRVKAIGVGGGLAVGTSNSETFFEGFLVSKS